MCIKHQPFDDYSKKGVTAFRKLKSHLNNPALTPGQGAKGRDLEAGHLAS